jgi:hypothetical protein
VIDPGFARAASRYGVALATSSLAGFFAVVGPAHWVRGVCDEIAINWLALTVIGGFGLAFAARFESDSMPVRCAKILLVGVAAIALFLWIEPRCLRGPYAMMDPTVWPIWLAHVHEMKPLIGLIAESPLTGIAIAAFPALALLAALVLARSGETRRDFGFLVASAIFLTAAATTIAAVKAASYLIWLAMPLVACFALHLFAALRLRSLVPRVAIGLLLTPAVLSLGAITIANAAGLGAYDRFSRSASDTCFRNESYGALAKLPPGLIATDIDYGPFLLALTPHAVLAAPYHRLSDAILTAHRALALPPADARFVLTRTHTDYVVTCGTHLTGLAAADREASLWGRLQAGDVPSWLESVPVAGPFAVYRMKN